MIWCALGIVAGVLFGIIPGAGAFLAVAVFYPFLALVSPFEILLFYVALIITSNYTNSVTGILYGIQVMLQPSHLHVMGIKCSWRVRVIMLLAVMQCQVH